MSLSPSGPHVAITSIISSTITSTFSFTSILATGMTAGIAVPAPEVSAERIRRRTPCIPGDLAP